jgi:hypothetical protein
MTTSDSSSDKPGETTQAAEGSGIAQASGGATATVTTNIVNKFELPSELISALLGALSGGGLRPTGQVEFPRAWVITGPPTAPAHPITRQSLVDAITQSLAARKPVLLRGEFGSGRTELARAITSASPNLLWLDIQANALLTPSIALDHALMTALPSAVSAGCSDYAEIIANLPEGTALVVENVDCVVSDLSFSTRLFHLSRAAKISRAFLLCSSIHKLPQQFDGLFDEVQVARFNSDDIGELLQAYGAPDSVNTLSFRNSVVTLTQGEPALATVMMQYLGHRKWRLSDQAWDDLLRGSFATDLKTETQRRLLGSEKETTREFLYRLSLLNRPFTETEALEIARIEPEIPNALQELNANYGTWLQKSSDSHWRTSVLLSGLGDGNLSKPVRKQVHLAAVDWVFAPKKVNQLGVCEAVTHLMLAEKFNNAAQVLIQALYALKEAGPNVDPGLILALWKDLPLPSEMDLGLRIVLRGLQASVLIQRGESYEWAINDLHSLIRQPSTDFEYIGTFASCALVAMQLLDKRPSDALPFIGVATCRQFEITERKIMRDLPECSIVEMFWGAAMRINDREGVDKWVREVDQVSREQRAALFHAQFAADSACRMFDIVWMREQDLPEEKRNWDALLAFLDSCRETVSCWDSSLLLGCVLRAKQAIRIVHTRKIDAAVEDAKNFVAAFPETEHATGRFLVAQGTGLWLTNVDRWDLATFWLGRACEYAGNDLAYHRQQNYLRYGNALYREGTPEVGPFEAAVRLGAESEYLTPVNRIKARAELAIFLWLTGRKLELFDQWSTVVRETLENRENTRSWKESYVFVGNNTNFWANRLRPEARAKTVVMTPELGMFIGDYKDFSDHYSDGILFTLPGIMSWFAERMERFKDAAEWAAQAADYAESVSGNPSGKSFLFQAVPYALTESRYEEAVSQCAQAMRALVLDVPLNAPEAVKSENPYLNRPRARTVNPTDTECHAIQLGVLPSLVSIVAGSFEDAAQSARHFDELISTCNLQNAISTAPDVWNETAASLAFIKDGRLSYADIADSGAANAGPVSHMRFLLLSFGLMAVGETLTRDTLAAQVRWSSWISKVYAGFGGIAKLLVRSIATSWERYVLARAFAFRQPAYVAKMIVAAGRRGEIGKIYIEVADGLGVSLPPDYRKSLMTAVVIPDEESDSV